jgi:methyl-accepting chemotaxis protein
MTARENKIVSKLSLKMKLAVGFGGPLLILMATGVVSYFSLQRLDELSADATEKARAAVVMRNIESRINDQKAEVRGYLLDSGRQEELEQYSNNNRLLADSFAKLDSYVRTEKGRRILVQLREGSDGYHRVLDRILELQRAGKTQEASSLMYEPETVALHNQAAKALSDLLARSEELAGAARREQEAMESRAMALILGFVIVGLVVGFGMAAGFARNITGRVSQIVGTIQAIAEGNLSLEDMQIKNHDEVGRAGILLNQMKNDLRGMIRSIVGAAEHVASASEEIASAVTQSAEGSRTQSDQTAQLATAMQEMSSSVGEVSSNSTRAADSARQAADVAKHGGRIVNEALVNMRSIAESVGATAKRIEELGKNSDQIGKIVAVIDDIADQTNLLALNAAIEAARAGEQGRGFAVVADEVRKLAERTTKATKEIAQMIDAVQKETGNAVAQMQAGTKQVEAGLSTTGKAGVSLGQIIAAAQQVGDMVTQIATAATQQSNTAEQINCNIEQIAKITQESAAGAQQSAKACQELSNLAIDLQQNVSRFNLDGGVDDSRPDSTRYTRVRPSRDTSVSPRMNRTNGHGTLPEYDYEQPVSTE